MFSNFFKNSKDIMLLTDVDGIIIQVNHAFTEILGYDEKELIGSNIFGYIAENELQDTKDYSNYVKNNLAQDGLIINNYKHKNGDLVEIEWNFSFDYDEKSNLRHWQRYFQKNFKKLQAK